MEVTQPLRPELLTLLRMLVFSWWVGNGDLHLKNLSLLRGMDGRYRMSPVYDVLSTELVLGDDALALSVGGKKKNLTRRTWLEYAIGAGVAQAACEHLLDEIISMEPAGGQVVHRSYLPEEMKRSFLVRLRARTKALKAGQHAK